MTGRAARAEREVLPGGRTLGESAGAPSCHEDRTHWSRSTAGARRAQGLRPAPDMIRDPRRRPGVPRKPVPGVRTLTAGTGTEVALVPVASRQYVGEEVPSLPFGGANLSRWTGSWSGLRHAGRLIGERDATVAAVLATVAFGGRREARDNPINGGRVS